MNRTIGVGLIGFGTIGEGTVRLLLRHPSPLLAAEDLDIRLVKIADLDITRPRSVSLDQRLLTTDAEEIIQHDQVDIVVELTGSREAKDLILRALRSGKSVVTAHKALISEHGGELFQAAHENGVDLMFEASVAGGVPIIRSLRKGLLANEFVSVHGILNGTTNYILTQMTRGEGNFEEILQVAQERGYAEPDPTMDISGVDAAQKLSILSRITFRTTFCHKDIFCEGIQKIGSQDIDYARELGYTIKLLAISKKARRGIEARVHPAMIPSDSLMANINDEFNAIEVVGDAVGTQVFYGKGAGAMPTASAILSDIVALAEWKASGTEPTVGQLIVSGDEPTLIPMEEVEIRYYLRFLVLDQPGVLAQIARILAVHRISIASVIQKGRSLQEGGTVPLVMMTHEAKERNMGAAVAEIDKLPEVREGTRLIRVEEL